MPAEATSVPYPELHRGPFAHVLAAVDLGETSMATMELTRTLAPQHVTLLHVLPPPVTTLFDFSGLTSQGRLSLPARAVRKQLRQLSATLAREPFSVQTQAVSGVVPHVILTAARETGAEAIVLGRKGESRAREAGEEAIWEHVCRNAHVPVLLAPAGATQRARRTSDVVPAR